MIFVSFYTRGTIYEEGIYKLIAGLEQFKLPYYVKGFDQAERGWREVCGSRGDFLVDVMEKTGQDVCWIDADAEILRKPNFILNLPRDVDMSFYIKNEVHTLLGTSYFRNCDKVKSLLKEWSRRVPTAPKKYISQAVFKELFFKGKFNFVPMPEEYCHIFDDRLKEDPVIVHYQYSRTKDVNWKVKKFNFTRRLGSVGLCVRDTGWAFHHRCLELKKRLSHLFDIELFHPSQIVEKGKSYDLVYFPTYESIPKYSKHCNKICANIAGLVVYNLSQSIDLFGPASGLVVPNLTWYRAYQEMSLPYRFYYIHNGVDTRMFYPTDAKNRQFTLGWVGNDTPPRDKVKRVDEVRRVAQKLDIPMQERLYKKTQIPHEMMPSYYHMIDAYINCSTTEGSNNPVLEACASGLPIIGTPVGNMPELYPYGAIPVEKSLRDLEKQLKMMKEMSLEERQAIGQKLRKLMIEEFDWQTVAEKYAQVFVGSLLG